MPQYMLSVRTAAGEPRESMTEEQQRQGYALIADLEAEMEAADAFVFSARLSDAGEATVIRRGAGRPKSTDGPFAARATDFQVEAAGRSWYANCAWDAFGIGAALGV
ncbi:MAG: hypothetical protein H0V73_09505, partial [Chloroflexi bacterium]|nr:hypothetical protein [Chloroflexota bacterium]